MINNNLLCMSDREKISGEANRLRHMCGIDNVLSGVPVGKNIEHFLDALNITLIRLPVDSNNTAENKETQHRPFQGMSVKLDKGGQQNHYIVINTNNYYDDQIFYIAHELYHYLENGSTDISRKIWETHDIREEKADYFAAELLLPENRLKEAFMDEFGSSNGSDESDKTMMRFIALMQCEWFVPYKAIIRRMEECSLSTDKMRSHLYCDIDERDQNGEYWRIANAIDEASFKILNTITMAKGTDPKSLDIILRNYDDELIDIDEAEDCLKLFDKKLEDYGYEAEELSDDRE